MATATITVQELREPAPGKKKGIIVDTNGDYYYVWPNDLAQYQQGGVYDVSYEASQFRNMTIRNINSSRPSSQPAAAPAPRAAPQSSANGAAAPTGSYYRPTSPEDKLSMFVTAAVKAGIQGGQIQFNDEAIADAIEHAVNGYRNGWAAARASAQQQPAAPPPQRQAPQPAHVGGRAPMDDEIPFAPEWR